MADGRRTPRVALVALGLAVALVGAGLFGFGLGRSTRSSARAVVSDYRDPTPCTRCSIALSSVEVQARPGSTLVMVRGSWPSTPGSIPGDIRFEGTSTGGTAAPVDIVVGPAPNSAGFVAVASPGVAAAPAPGVAVGLEAGALLIDIPDATLAAPFRFAVGIWDGHAYTARLPQASFLEWSGAGAPTPLAG